MQPIEIFRPGSFNDMQGTEATFTLDNLYKIAASYNPELFEAPAVIGHPKHDLPAYGWVERLEVAGEKLLAHFRQLEPAFLGLVREGRFKKISASFYGPTHSENPTPGNHYLKHVGFLGAAAPAVKGLKQVSFSNFDNGNLCFSQEIAFEEGTTKVDRKALDDEWRKLADYRAKMKRSELMAFIEDLARQGKPLAGEYGQNALALMESMDDNQQDLVCFGEESYSQLNAFKEFIASLANVVQFGEVDKGEEFSQSIPDYGSVSVDMDSLELHQKALVYAEKESIDYASAVRIVSQAG